MRILVLNNLIRWHSLCERESSFGQNTSGEDIDYGQYLIDLSQITSGVRSGLSHENGDLMLVEDGYGWSDVPRTATPILLLPMTLAKLIMPNLRLKIAITDLDVN